jgi:mannosyltransferase OCH1-like enzyme
LGCAAKVHEEVGILGGNVNNIIQSLWIGDKLSPMEQKSIESFLRHGHEYHLYTYNDVAGVPSGAVIKDANALMSLTTFEGLHYAVIADFFRYRLLFEKGGWWSDTDAICVKHFDFEDEFVFSSEYLNTGGKHINNGTIRVPKRSRVIQYCMAACESTVKSRIKWGATGPALIQDAVLEFELESFVQQPEVFCPINPWDARKFMEPYADLEIPTKAHAVHLWNECWKTHGLNKWEPVTGSFYDNLEPKGDTSEFDELMKRLGV